MIPPWFDGKRLAQRLVDRLMRWRRPTYQGLYCFGVNKHQPVRLI
jgi:hypothetical protein